MKRYILARLVPPEQMPAMVDCAALLGITGFLPVFSDGEQARRYAASEDEVIDYEARESGDQDDGG